MILVDAAPGSAAGTAYAAALAGEQVAFASDGNAEILIAGRNVDALLAANPALRWVAFWNAGIDKSITPLLLERIAQGLLVTNASGIHGAQMAEHTIGLMLAHTRGIATSVRNQERGVWDRSPHEGHLQELSEQSLGVVGMGHIGQALAMRAEAFGMRVVGVRRTHTRDELAAVLACDHVVVFLPLTPETHHFIGREELALMKPSGILYNLGRGPVVDEVALVDALARGAIAGAGLDVFEQEPLPRESPLWTMKNVVLTPHTAGLTPAYYRRTAALFVANLARYRRGDSLAQRHRTDRGY